MFGLTSRRERGRRLRWRNTTCQLNAPPVQAASFQPPAPPCPSIPSPNEGIPSTSHCLGPIDTRKGRLGRPVEWTQNHFDSSTRNQREHDLRLLTATLKGPSDHIPKASSWHCSPPRGSVGPPGEGRRPLFVSSEAALVVVAGAPTPCCPLPCTAQSSPPGTSPY